MCGLSVKFRGQEESLNEDNQVNISFISLSNIDQLFI